MNKTITLSEINKEALELLYNELGISKTLKFLSQFSLGEGDYVKWKNDIYKGKTVDDLVNAIKKNS